MFRDFRQRLMVRLRHGLVTQELLDRLAKRGLRIYPYFLVRELPMERPEIEALGSGLETRFLETSELPQVSEIPQRRRDLALLRQRQRHGNCFGVWEAGQLAAYSWYSSDPVPAAGMGQILCSLPCNSLYLYDAYVRPEFRGRRIAGFMRHKLHAALSDKGAEGFVSITLAFNKSSRRFKAILGAQETELRLLFTAGRLGGFDMRISQRENFIATRRFMRLGPFTT